MSNKLKLGFGLVLAGLFVAVGCRNEVPPAVPSTTPSDQEPKPLPLSEPPATRPAQPADTPALPTEGNPEPGLKGTPVPPVGDQTEASKIEANLASLGPEDRALAATQKICPVSEAMLGSMGTPIKISVAGRDVLICCEHCEEAVKAEPAKYLAKIGLEPAQDVDAH